MLANFSRASTTRFFMPCRWNTRCFVWSGWQVIDKTKKSENTSSIFYWFSSFAAFRVWGCSPTSSSLCAAGSDCTGCRWLMSWEVFFKSSSGYGTKLASSTIFAGTLIPPKSLQAGFFHVFEMVLYKWEYTRLGYQFCWDPLIHHQREKSQTYSDSTGLSRPQELRCRGDVILKRLVLSQHDFNASPARVEQLGLWLDLGYIHFHFTKHFHSISRLWGLCCSGAHRS